MIDDLLLLQSSWLLLWVLRTNATCLSSLRANAQQGGRQRDSEVT